MPALLAIDVGGSHVKALSNSAAGEPRRIKSGPDLTAAAMVAAVRALAADWRYEAVSIGFPGPAPHGRPLAEPPHLGGGWVGFDFAAAFGCPVKLVNDAAMQALGSYDGGRMLFLGLGTGLGSALIVDGQLVPMELAHLPYRKRTFEHHVGERARQRKGRKQWRRAVAEVIDHLRAALEPDYVVVGGGNARWLDRLPDGVRRGDNRNAFLGGFRLWDPGHPAPAPADSAPVDKAC